MASTTTTILEDLAATARAAGLFELVPVGSAGSETVTPRAELLWDGQERLASDDRPGAAWGRVQATFRLRVRSASPAEGLARLAGLCESLTAALLENRFRGGACRDLPIGAATEVRAGQPRGDLRHPELEASLHVRCHFEDGEEA